MEFRPEKLGKGALGALMPQVWSPGQQTGDMSQYLLEHQDQLSFLNIKTTWEEDQEMIRVISERLARDEDYQTATNNCSTSICQILIEALNLSPRGLTGKNVSDPQTAFKKLEEIAKEREQERMGGVMEHLFNRIDDRAWEVKR